MSAQNLASTTSVGNRRLHFGLILLIAVCAFIAHSQSIQYPFVHFDDYLFVKNPVMMQGLTLHGIYYAFTNLGDDSNWVPITRLSHMLDLQLYGQAAWGHHLTNILLHTINAVLLYLLLGFLTATRWRSALVALLFATHPAHVESIAWISERRDVLSMFFGLLTLMAYARYATTNHSKMKAKVGLYLLICLGTLLAVMAKPLMVTLPCLMLLLDFWPLDRVSRAWKSPGRLVKVGGLLLEKLPLFCIVGLSMIFTYMAQAFAQAMPLNAWPLTQRLVVIPTTYVAYFKMLLWPVNLSPLYTMTILWSLPWVVFCLYLLSAITYVAARLWRRCPYVLMGWLWFLGSMVPMIGLVKVGLQAQACRYAYLPFIGLYIAIVWTVAAMLKRTNHRRIILAGRILAGLLIVLLIVGSLHQTRIWSSTLALRYASNGTTGDNLPFAHIFAGELVQQGKKDQARAALNRAAAYSLRDSFNAINALAIMDIKDGQLDAARMRSELLVRAKIDTYITWLNLASIAMQRHNPAKAARYYENSLKKKPNVAEVYLKLSLAHEAAGQTQQADIAYQRALSLTPDDAYLKYRVGIMMYDRQNYPQAIEYLKQSVTMPAGRDNAQAWYALGISLSRNGDPESSIPAYLHALELVPSWSQVNNSLGVALAQTGRFPEAAIAFEHAIAAEPGNITAKENLLRAQAKMAQPDKPAPASAGPPE